MKFLVYTIGLVVAAPLMALAVAFGAFMVILLYVGDAFGDLVMNQ